MVHRTEDALPIAGRTIYLMLVGLARNDLARTRFYPGGTTTSPIATKLTSCTLRDALIILPRDLGELRRFDLRALPRRHMNMGTLALVRQARYAVCY